MNKLGIQKEGISPGFTKKMALSALQYARLIGDLKTVADIGGGCGELAVLLAPRSREVWLVDYSPPKPEEVPSNVKLIQTDLNESWLLPESYFDFTFSLECIEHVENPRHFMRELTRITKPSGFIFVSTPNNHSFASKLTFLVRGQHRLFQESSYPAHISPLLKCDFDRMSLENNLKIIRYIYSNTDTIPKLNITLNLPGSTFSLSFGILMQKGS